MKNNKDSKSITAIVAIMITISFSNDNSDRSYE